MDLTGLAARSPRESRILSKGARSRRNILEAATQILGSQGPAGLTIPNIATRAGVSKGSVYYYFNDIGQLTHEVVGQELDKLVSAFERAAVDARSADDAMQRITDAFIGMLDNSVALVRFLLGEVHFMGDAGQGGFTDVRDRILRLISTQVERGKAEGTVRRDVDSDIAAAAILGIFLAVAVYGIMDRENAARERLSSSINALVGFGIASDERRAAAVAVA